MAYIEHPSPWLAVGALATVAVGARLTRLPAVIQPASGRLASLDGLRGLLAFSVFIHHFFVSYQWKHTGRWAVPPTHLHNLMGSCSVALFFMITGFLFFGRIKATRGLLDVNGFVAGRVIRLGPVYLVCVALMILCAYQSTGWAKVAPLQTSLDAYLFFQAATINAYPDTNLISAGVLWTLSYEWLFYLAWPALAWLWARLACGSWALFLLSVLCLWLGRNNVEIPVLRLQTAMLAPFALGGLVGEVNRLGTIRRLLRSPFGAGICGFAALAVFFLCDTAYSATGYVLLALVFAPVAAGNGLFGILQTRTFVMLGEISYDVYLLHGIVLFVLFTLLMPDALAHAGMPGRVFSLLLIAATCTFALAAAVHLLVERPALRLGRRLVLIDRAQELAAP